MYCLGMETFFEALGTKVLYAGTYSDLSYHVGKYGNDVFWIVDEKTAKMVRPLPEPNVIIPVGEKYKNFDTVQLILKEAQRSGVTRNTRFIGFGGGVVLDIASFCASVYMRGAKLSLIPTTLLAMVDASLGGKTGINYLGTKNLIGTFYPADEIIICTEPLNYLDKKQYLNGMAEVIKHTLLSEDSEYFNFVKDNKEKILAKDKEVLKEMILKSLQIKLSFVSDDLNDTSGHRIALNLGHTFAHALESHFKMLMYTHGEAVAWGICRALEIGVRMGLTDIMFAQEAIKLFASFGFEIAFKINRVEWQDFKQRMYSDKKKLGSDIQFVLLKNQGDFVAMSLDMNLVMQTVIRQAI